MFHFVPPQKFRICINIREYHLNKHIHNSSKKKLCEYACFPIYKITLCLNNTGYAFFKRENTFLKRENTFFKLTKNKTRTNEDLVSSFL